MQKENVQEPLAYNVRKARELAGIGRTKFYALIRSGELRTRRVGSRHLVPAEELKRFLALPEEELK